MARTVRARSESGTERTRLLSGDPVNEMGVTHEWNHDREHAADLDEEESEDEDDEDDDDDDEDDIVDIPARPSLRSRKSTASFFLDEDGRMRAGPPVTATTPPRARATSFRHYGSLGEPGLCSDFSH